MKTINKNIKNALKREIKIKEIKNTMNTRGDEGMH
jgi:hypothetical protein